MFILHPLSFQQTMSKTEIIHGVRFLHVNKQTKHIKNTQIIGHPQNISFSTSLKCHSAEGSEDKCTLLLKCHSVKGKMCVYFRKKHTQQRGASARYRETECRAKRGRFRAQITDGNCHWRKLGLFSSSPISTYLLLVIVASHTL